MASTISACKCKGSSLWINLSTLARSVLQCVAVCCSVLQCVAVWCSVLQSGAVWCSVVQHVAMCCGYVCTLVCIACVKKTDELEHVRTQNWRHAVYVCVCVCMCVCVWMCEFASECMVSLCVCVRECMVSLRVDVCVVCRV